MLTLLATLWVVVTITIQAKDGLYWDQFPMNMFLPLTIKVFGCLHQKQTNSFFDVPTWCGERRPLEALLF
jgi:1,2-phenylacetyl-CoA epoxidase PaaB subunit